MKDTYVIPNPNFPKPDVLTPKPIDRMAVLSILAKFAEATIASIALAQQTGSTPFINLAKDMALDFISETPSEQILGEVKAFREANRGTSVKPLEKVSESIAPAANEEAVDLQKQNFDLKLSIAEVQDKLSKVDLENKKLFFILKSKTFDSLNLEKMLAIIDEFGQDLIRELVSKPSEFTPGGMSFTSELQAFKNRLGQLLTFYCKDTRPLSIPIMEKLINSGANVEYSMGHPLYSTIITSQFEAAKYLLGVGADINADDCYTIKKMPEAPIIFFILINGGRVPDSNMDQIRKIITMDYLKSLRTTSLPFSFTKINIIRVANILSYNTDPCYYHLYEGFSDEEYAELDVATLGSLIVFISGSEMASKKDILEKISATLISKF